MRYVVLGAGAIGGGIGGRLAAAGLDVTMVARGRHLEAMAAHGLELRTPRGATTVEVRAVDEVAAAGLRPGDVVLLAVKSQDTAAALDRVVAAGQRDVVVVCAQNGVDNERQALRFFRQVYGVCVLMPATYLEPGVIELADATTPGILDVGRFPAGIGDVGEALAADLRRGGFVAEAVPAIMARKYRKLLGNLSNVIDAASGPAGRAAGLAVAAGEEARACFEAAGIDVASKDEARSRGHQMPRSWQSSAGDSPSSSRQSLLRGAGSIETDWLNGEVVLLGRLHGVPTPVNELLVRLADRLLRDAPPAGSIPLEQLEFWAAG